MVSLLQSSLPGCLIPAYVSLNQTSWWQWIIQIKNTYPQTPMAVIINTSNTGGGAGSSTNAGWNTQINSLRAAGIIVLGYVDTAGSGELQSNVESRVAAWDTHYGQIDGIFFDNIGILAEHQTYNTAIANYAKARFDTVAANCKVAATTVATTWHSQTVPIDTFVIYDNAGLDVIDTSYTKFSGVVNKNQLAYFSHTAPVIDQAWTQQMAQYVGWIYTTSETNYNSFPTYLGTLVRLLEDIRAGRLGSGTAVDKWGIEKIYHTKVGANEWFMNREDIFNDPVIDNVDGEGITHLSNGRWRATGGTDGGQLRIEAWSPALTPDSARLAARWLNVEITIYSRVTSLQESSPPYSHQLYSRGGHHSSAGNRCEGSALKARYDRDANSVMFVKEVCHACYTGNRAVASGGLPSGDTFGSGRWHGTKHCIYNIVENGNTYTKQESYVDPNCTDASGNLVIANNWSLRSTNIDRGDWYCDQARYDNECQADNCPHDRNEILIEPGMNSTSGHKNFHRSLCAYRTDGLTSEFDYFSAREIDPTKPVATTPTGGGTTSPQPPAPPGSSGGGGGGGGTPPPTEEPGEQSPFDPFGVKKIYPTAANGDEFFMNMTNITSNRGRFDPKVNTSGMTRNADGTWKIRQSAGVSMQVYQKNGYDPVTTANSALDHALCHNRGYMQDADDFKNVECTVYVKLNNTVAVDDFFWLVRGGEHEKSQPNCEGCALRIHLGSDGSSEMRKEQWHINTLTTDRKSVLGTGLLGKWVGIKCVVINKIINNSTLTSQQLWVDINNTNQWQLVDQRTDAGGWGTRGAICKGAPDQLLTWGAPMIQFGWTTFSDVDVKWLSVREIDPAGVPMDAPPVDPIGSCAGA